MSKIIEEQLKKVSIADLSNYSNGTYYIPRFKQIKLEKNNCYLVKVEDNILDKDYLINVNFNHNTAPKTNYLKIEVNNIVNKLIYVNSVGYDYENKKDLTNLWIGWIPIRSIDIIEKLD